MKFSRLICHGRTRSSFAVAVTILIALTSKMSFSQGTAPAVSCESLAKLALPDTTISMARTVGAGEFTISDNRKTGPARDAPLVMGPGTSRAGGPPPGGRRSVDTKSLPAFCQVAATIKPTSDSDIRIEVFLPISGWNGKFMGRGGGGFAGELNEGELADGLKRGYATATTDSGHDSTKDEAEGIFVLGHPEKMIDYGYRAVHLMTVEGKEITKAFYGVAPKHAYFFGSSRGGYEGLTEARRFPEDYDGIDAGWPPNPFVLFNAEQLWANWLINKEPSRLIPQPKYAMIHEAVMKACDALDGVTDGVINEPNHCNFEPKMLLCKGADTPDCLTVPQVELLTKTYQGPVNPRTGKVIFPGPAMGDELGEMYQFATGNPRAVAMNMFRYFVFKDPNWDWTTLNWDSDIDLALKETGPALVTDANLKGFADHGGKLMIHIGWINYHNPVQIIDYYNDVVKNVGAAKVNHSIRLFAIPGQWQETLFDKVKVIEQWAEQGQAPDQITGTYHIDDKVRTRPLCAYPKVAQYKGTGDTDQAENFVCAISKLAGKR